MTFAAFALFFAAAFVYPQTPDNLKALGGSIYLPEAYGVVLGLDVPKSRLSSIPTDSVPFSYLPLLVSCLIAIVAVSAIIRSRWLFAGLSTAFFLVPWSLFGFTLPLAPYVLPLFALVAFGFQAPVSRRMIIAIAIVATIGAPLIIGMISDIHRHLFAGSDTARYRVIGVTELPPENKWGAARLQLEPQEDDSGGASDGARQAIYYVQAQPSALRRDAAASAAALIGMDGIPLPLNYTDRVRVDAIRKFAVAAGAFGSQARDDFTREMTTRHNSATALFFAGLALAAAAPLANLVGRSLRRRGRRITLITQELEGLKTASVGTGVLQFGSAAAKGSKRPLSMIMGERTVNAIAARLRIYCILFAALLTASVVFASAAYWVWVPDPARNSVFRTVSLAGDAYEFAGEAGLQVAIRMDEPRAGSIMWQYLSYGTCIGLIVLATRRSRYLGLAVAIVILSFLGLNSIRLPDHSRYEVEASQLSPEMRSQLADAAGLGMKSGIEPERNAFPTASLTLRGTASLEGAAAHRSPVRMAAINPSIAAYTLAQLAYLDADTAAASTWLNRIENIVDLHPTVHQLKLASVQEWLSANGISSAEQWFSTDFVAMVRLIAHFLLAASIFAMASGAVVAIAVMIAARRGNRIEALMEERDRSPT